MTEKERGTVHAVGLLRALADQAMQENGRADAQGAAAAGMDIGSPATTRP